jgi:hypothetical protein
MNKMRKMTLAMAIIAMAFCLSGCGAIAVGWLIGDAISTHNRGQSAKVGQCHAIVAKMNADNKARGLPAVDDTCEQ